MTGLAFGYRVGDRWRYRGFSLRCFAHGVEVVGTDIPEPLRVVFAHRARAAEAIDAYLEARP
jgi:hypothetical protein